MIEWGIFSGMYKCPIRDRCPVTQEAWSKKPQTAHAPPPLSLPAVGKASLVDLKGCFTGSSGGGMLGQRIECAKAQKEDRAQPAREC